MEPFNEQFFALNQFSRPMGWVWLGIELCKFYTTPLPSTEKSHDPPYWANPKSHDTPMFLPPPPSPVNNEHSLSVLSYKWHHVASRPTSNKYKQKRRYDYVMHFYLSSQFFQGIMSDSIEVVSLLLTQPKTILQCLLVGPMDHPLLLIHTWL